MDQRIFILIPLLACLGACQPAGPVPENLVGVSSTMPLAFAMDQVIDWPHLQPIMIELAGGQALSELVLDRMVDRRLADRGIKLVQLDYDVEREIIRKSLDPDPDAAQHALKTMRHRRGWGPVRFQAMLKRNAALRKLAQGQVKVTDNALANAYEIVYGPKYEARLIVTARASQASQLLNRARKGESFVSLAIEHSIDESSVQGGLLPLISSKDPSWPQSVREALVQLDPGQVSPPIALVDGFAIIKLLRKIDRQAVELDDIKQQLREGVRRQAETLLMKKIARQMLVEAKITVFDLPLSESWKNQKRRILPQLQ